MLVELRTPTAELFRGEAHAVRLKTDLGDIEILPDHATLIATILYSKVYIRHESTEETFIVRQGSVSVNEQGEVRILAHDAHKDGELSVENMKDYLDYVVQKLDTGELNEYQKQFLEKRRAALEEEIDQK